MMACKDCGRLKKKIISRGLCGACYQRHWANNTLDQFPRLVNFPKATETHKVCRICLNSLPLAEFAPDRRNSDGCSAYCKECAREKYHVPARQRKRKIVKPVDGERSCVTCNCTLRVSQFTWESDKGRFRPQCKSCHSARMKLLRDGDPLAYRDKIIRRKYGISLAEFDEMLALQGGGCAICGSTVNPDARSLAVDHCHGTGRVRGILCGRCNKAIGLFNDDPLLLEKAVIYLRR